MTGILIWLLSVLNLNKEDEVYFLRSYFTMKNEISYEKLKAYKVIYKALCSQWFEALTN